MCEFVNKRIYFHREIDIFLSNKLKVALDLETNIGDTFFGVNPETIRPLQPFKM